MDGGHIDTRGEGTGPERGLPGAFVVSLDFELRWGVRELCHGPDSYLRNVLGAREAIPRILDLFERYGIRATWATVGFLFASTKEEMRRFWPSTQPRYADERLNPYADPTGDDEASDPANFAASLVDRIRETPGQDIGSHTFSHYYCLEEGNSRESFAADLECAVAIARNRGIELRSLVFPRHQFNADYTDTIRDFGFSSFRGVDPSWVYRPCPESARTHPAKRGIRMLDRYVHVAGSRTLDFASIQRADGLCNVAATHFLSPFQPKLARFGELFRRRITDDMDRAARNGRMVHLWWHPHNFGTHLEANLAMLEGLLTHYERLNGRYGFQSMSMDDVACRVKL